VKIWLRPNLPLEIRQNTAPLEIGKSKSGTVAVHGCCCMQAASGTAGQASFTTHLVLYVCVQCIDELKAERRQLQEQVDAFEEKLDECRAENAQLQQLQCVDQRLQCKTAECQQLAACNVSHCC